MTIPASRPAGRQPVGILLVLLSAMAFAIGPTAAKLALDAGSNTLTVVTLRAVIGMALMGTLIAASGQGFRVGKRALVRCLYAGLAYTLMSCSFIGSIACIPVSLAVLIFFTHPILVAAIYCLRGRERLTTRKLGLALAVLAGMALVLGDEFAGLDATGVGLAALAAVTMCGTILCMARAQQHATSTQVNTYATAVMVVVFAVATTALNAWSFPSGIVGWLGLTAAGVSIAIGLLTFFAAFRFIGPVRATMLSNVEPLFSVLLAVAVLGEHLGPRQWSGAALVIAALLLFEAPARRDVPRKPDTAV